MPTLTITTISAFSPEVLADIFTKIYKTLPDATISYGPSYDHLSTADREQSNGALSHVRTFTVKRTRIHRGEKSIIAMIQDMFPNPGDIIERDTINKHFGRLGYSKTSAGAEAARLVKQGRLKKINERIWEVVTWS